MWKNSHNFLIILQYKKGGTFPFEQTQILLIQVWIWLKLAQWFYRRLLNFVNVFSLFHNHLPLEREGALHLNNLIYPWPKDDFCQVWLELAQWFWRRRFLKSSMHFSNFLIISPIISRSASFVQTWIPFTQGCFVSSVIEIGPVVLERIFKFH